MSTNQYALTTREAVKQFRLANGEVLKTTTEVNNLIDSIIDAVSSKFESYCDRKFKSQSHEEYFDGKNSNVIYPNNYPITTVTSVHDDSEWLWGSDTLISGTEYRISNDENSIVFKNSSTTLGNYTQNVKLNYTAGYTTVPYDLEHVCIVEVLRTFDNIKNIGVFSKSEVNTSFAYVIEAFLNDTLIILNLYKKRTAY